MEIIFIIVIILIIAFKKVEVLEKEETLDLPIGTNDGKYFDENAFTEIYYKLKG